MKPVKTMQKYKCDFCQKRSTKSIIALHEKRCFRNPNRYCDYCDNKGFTEEYDENAHASIKFDCPYCSSFDKQKLKEIEEREKREKEETLF